MMMVVSELKLHIFHKIYKLYKIFIKNENEISNKIKSKAKTVYFKINPFL